MLDELLKKIVTINETIFQHKMDIAAQLREHVGNKKKINAYKGNKAAW
ncbi:hypothetical protein PALB_6050 [Pseudoalteromonas luteoviolacea B = ATCC 29581]|nr:hypothetical protein PALB_6050 [Pseudoalteromonas luteoviolacea B = ATCC 29581]